MIGEHEKKLYGGLLFPYGDIFSMCAECVGAISSMCGGGLFSCMGGGGGIFGLAPITNLGGSPLLSHFLLHKYLLLV